MNLVLTPSLELRPPSIGGKQSVSISYRIGGLNVSRACDRIFVGGTERPERECFVVTGTLTSRQIERREIEIDPPAGVDFIEIKVLVREVDADNEPVDEVDLEASGQLSIL
jgi:hypothetical protein